MARKRFTDGAGFTRHCWECVHSYDWDEHIGFCDVYGNSVEKYDSPNNGSTFAGGCIHYRHVDKPKPKTNDERYRRVCDLLEEALQLTSEWSDDPDWQKYRACAREPDVLRRGDLDNPVLRQQGHHDTRHGVLGVRAHVRARQRRLRLLPPSGRRIVREVDE